MSNRNKYKKDLSQQMNDRLQRMLSPGRSRELDKRAGVDSNYIYSYKTYHTYQTQCRYFVNWIKREHPDAKTMRYARQYYREYMLYLEQQGYAASSLHTANAALMKVFRIQKTDRDFFSPPVRHKAVPDSQGSPQRNTRVPQCLAMILAQLAAFDRLTAPKSLRALMLTIILKLSKRMEQLFIDDFFDKTKINLSGKRIAITGTLPIKRDEAINYIIQAGGIYATTVSARTDYLCVGTIKRIGNLTKDTRKLAAAKLQMNNGGKVTLISPEELIMALYDEEK